MKKITLILSLLISAYGFAQNTSTGVVTLNANLDFLSWRNDNLPQNHISVKLKPLIDSLFDRILPLGVSQLVTGATRLMRGQPQSGLDHFYSNKPDKLSSVQTFITGLSDHKLIKVTRFARSFREAFNRKNPV